MAALARSFIRRLEELACPYVDNVDDSWIKELMFKPGEPRLRLLQWLLARFDPYLQELVDTQVFRPENLTDSRVQRLTFVSSTLGLCRSEDYDLIRGVASEAKQTLFMDRLLDLVCIAQDSEFATSDSRLSKEPASGLTKLAEQMRHDRRLMNGLANQGNVTEMLSPTCQLFPPDLMRLCHQHFDQTLASSGLPPQEHLRMRPPDHGKLDALVSEMSEQVASQLQILEELKKTTTSVSRQDRQVTDKVTRVLSVSMSTLGQLVSSFCQCYETELQTWTHKQPLHLSGLGQVCKRVFSLHQQLNALLVSLSKARVSCEGICEKAPSVTRQSDCETLRTFERCAKVLDDSVRRSRQFSLDRNQFAA